MNIDGSLSRDRAENHIYAFGQHLVGDFNSGNIYNSSVTIYSDYDRPLKVIRSSPHSTGSDMNGVFYKMFELGIDAGVGLDGIQQGDDPQVMLRWSNDGGNSWGPYKSRALGRIGEFTKRLRWNRLGWSRDRVFEVSITDPVPRVLMSATVLAEAQES